MASTCAHFAMLAALAFVLLPAARAVDSVVDRNALVDLFQTMGGAQWTNNANWLAPDVTMCSWYGVVCVPPGGCPSTGGTSVECRVAVLNLDANGLVGPIAPAVQLLANLTNLVLSGNALGGTIPSFDGLANLKILDLSLSRLTGSIPEFESLLNLRSLELYGNRLEGTIPAFAALTQLHDLRLCNNLLTGTVPAFTTNVQLLYLDLSSNRLDGTAPAFATLTSLILLSMHSNTLSGMLPAFATLTQLAILSLHNNTFAGTLPAYALPELGQLYLNNNRLEGTVPAFTSLRWLQILDLSGNQLEGTIPEFKSLTQLQELYLYDNLLSGQLPEFASLTKLQELSLSGNQLEGTIPEFKSLTQLMELYLYDNLLSGQLPEFASLTQLQELYLYSNRIEGTMPAFATLTQLLTLYLNDNLLSGTVPNFDSSTALRRLDLSANRLSGTLPHFSSLSNLTTLRIARNRLTGSLPVSWRTFRNLGMFDVADNMLDGEILIFQHVPLPPLSARFVNLSFNRFGGTFGELPPPELTSIDIRGNQLLCPYPEFYLGLLVLRSDCKNDWAQLGTYAGVAVGVVAVGIALFRIIKRFVSEKRVRIALFFLSWFVSVSSILSDAYSYAVIVGYLQKRSTTCVSMNEERVFYPLLETDGGLPESLKDVPGSFLFSDWIKPQPWIDSSYYGLDIVRVYTDRFSSACRQAPECEYDATLAQCYDAHPDLSTSGGGAHQTFLSLVFVFIAIRAAYELFCLIIIVVSCVRNSLVLSCRVWIKGSIFLPLLLVRASTRLELMDDVVLAVTPPSEYIWELLTSGVFVTGLKLFAQTYYLLRVAQTGLVWSNWLSLVLGLVTVVRLIGQATWSWRKKHRDALMEKHYAERAASGAGFELDEMTGGGSADMHDYVSI